MRSLASGEFVALSASYDLARIGPCGVRWSLFLENAGPSAGAPRISRSRVFWNALDLARKPDEFPEDDNAHRVHRLLGSPTPAERAGAPSPAPAGLDRRVWRQPSRGLVQIAIAA
jgi:hypothetical protein